MKTASSRPQGATVGSGSSVSCTLGNDRRSPSASGFDNQMAVVPGSLSWHRDGNPDVPDCANVHLAAGSLADMLAFGDKPENNHIDMILPCKWAKSAKRECACSYDGRGTAGFGGRRDVRQSSVGPQDMALKSTQNRGFRSGQARWLNNSMAALLSLDGHVQISNQIAATQSASTYSLEVRWRNPLPQNQ